MYFFIQVLFDNDGNVAGKGTTDYTDINACEQAYHTAIASAISKTEYSKIIAVIMNSKGNVLQKRLWERNPSESRGALYE